MNYSGEDYERRGRYSLSTGEMFKYEADITLNFNKTLKEVHQIYAGAGFNFAQDKSETYETVGEGIPDDYSDFLGLAAMYQKEGKPYGDEGISRRVGGILNVNYTYDRRYFVDFSGKIERLLKIRSGQSDGSVLVCRYRMERSSGAFPARQFRIECDAFAFVLRYVRNTEFQSLSSHADL